VIQSVQGRSLRRRLSAVSSHLEALRAGQLERRLPPDDEADELSEVRDVLGKTTEQLLLARDSRERLLANAAHELRTPLTVMRTRLDLALRRERSPEDLKVALSETREEVVRLSTLAGRLLDTAALARAPLETAPVDLIPLAKDALRAIEASPRGLSGTLQAPATLTVTAHAESVRQALDNLLSNAVKFAPDGSTIALTISPLESGARLAVRDSGPGIPADEREAIFEPFHRVRGGPPGTGLGLAIVREVARHHQGRAFVADTEHGAEVVLELGEASSREA
jgi:signal transduction histidine kinase